MLIKALFLML